MTCGHWKARLYCHLQVPDQTKQIQGLSSQWEAGFDKLMPIKGERLDTPDDFKQTYAVLNTTHDQV